jgi:NADH-quinone oxidoreductase subunit N
MAGLMGKFYLMSAAVKADFTGLAIVGMLASVVSCAFYLKVLMAIYFKEPEPGARGVGAISLPSVIGLTICLFATIFLGLFPSRIHDALSLIMSGF